MIFLKNRIFNKKKKPTPHIFKYILSILFSLAALVLFSSCSGKKNIDEQLQSEIQIESDNLDTNSKVETFKKVEPIILPTEELILDEKEMENSKLDKKWSGTSADGLSYTYRKKLDSYTERSVNLELYQFDDSASALNRFSEDMESHFSKTRPDGNGGNERNPFYSQKIKIEKIGDSSFCYKFVSPTIEVLYKNYIIASNVTIDYIYENLSENNASTLKKSKEIIKKQIEKIKLKTENH